MPKRSSLKDFLERPERFPDTSRSPSASHASAILRRIGPIGRPVQVAKLIRSTGLGLARAHETLNRLVQDEVVAVLLSDVPDRAAFVAAASDLGVGVEWREAPDEIDVKAIRQKIGLTQSEFAARFGFDVATVQNWEQGRNRPERAARILLRVIERHPEVVEEVLG